jgi:hypothetical protein
MDWNGTTGDLFETLLNKHRDAKYDFSYLEDDSKLGFFDGFFGIIQREDNNQEYITGYTVGQSAARYYRQAPVAEGK